MTTALLQTVRPETLYATYAAGGELTIDRHDDDPRVVKLVVTLGECADDGTPVDQVTLHVDDDAELEHLDRAIVALTAAREAFARS